MEILFLGTCACDYSPLLQTTYKDTFDKDARRSSCALVNGHYLIDCGEHCMDALRIAKVDPAQITDIFVTHFHSDHYNKEHIRQIAAASDRVLRVWVRFDAETPDIPNVEWNRMQKATAYTVDENMTLTGLLTTMQIVIPNTFCWSAMEKRFFMGLTGHGF